MNVRDSGDRGIARPIAKDRTGTVLRCGWAPSSMAIFAAALTGTQAKRPQVNPITGEISTAAELLSSSPDFSVSADGKRFAYLSDSPHSQGDAWVKSGADAARRLTRSNPQIDEIELSGVTEVFWPITRTGSNRIASRFCQPAIRLRSCIGW